MKRQYAEPHHWYWGMGAVISDLPVMQSRLTIPFSQLLYEYNVSDPANSARFAVGGGFYSLNGILPVPAFQPSPYIGSENNDIMARFSTGLFSDFVVGNHSGALFSAGIILKNRLELSIISVPFGGQPVRPYGEILGSDKEKFIEVSKLNETNATDPEGRSLVVYDENHRHPDDPDYDELSEEFYYSKYDIEYGNGRLGSNKQSDPGDFDYIVGREYISFPYFGVILTFRHGF